MAQNVYILYNEENRYAVDNICKNTFVNSKIYSKDLVIDENLLIEMATQSRTEYFYVISSRKDILFSTFDFTFKPPEWDNKYVHIWNNDTTVRLYHKETTLNNAASFTDKALADGLVQLKIIDEQIYTCPLFDIVFLSYDESYALKHYDDLKLKFPRTKRVQGVKGIYEAHKAAAKIVTSEMFYVVDADAVVKPYFEFDDHQYDLDRQTVHVWQSVNPINDLIYGYGGIKLFPTKLLKDYTGSPIDFTTSVSKSFKVMGLISNVSEFNTDPFSTWRSAFRECAKLASGLIHNQNKEETIKRLDTWCSVGENRSFGDFAIMGANEGREFGTKHANQHEMLVLINDYSWLEKRFSS